MNALDFLSLLFICTFAIAIVGVVFCAIDAGVQRLRRWINGPA